MASTMFPSDHYCPVCHEEFTQPKLLSCNHRVCRKCLLSWLQAEGEGEGGCPLCRAPIRPKSGKQKAESADVISLVDDLPTDLATMAIVQSRKALSGSDVCAHCDVGVAATSFCVHCSLKLCRQCANAHWEIPTTRDHVLEDLGKVTPQRLVASYRTHCDVHTHTLAELYCWHHHTLVCGVCATVEHRGCEGRGVERVDDVAKRERIALPDQASILHEIERDIDSRTDELELEIHDVQAHFKTLKSNVSGTFDRVHQTLDQRLQEIMAAIESREEEILKEKIAEKQALDQQRSAVVCQVRILDELLDSYSDSTLVGMLHALKGRLDDLENQPYPERAGCVRGLSKVVFDSQKLATLERDIAGLGQVTEEEPEHRCKCGTVISSGMQSCEKCDTQGTQLVGPRVRYCGDKEYYRGFYGDGTIIQQGTGPGRHGDGWVQVKWDKGAVGWYKMGADDVYTVMFV